MSAYSLLRVNIEVSWNRADAYITVKCFTLAVEESENAGVWFELLLGPRISFLTEYRSVWLWMRGSVVNTVVFVSHRGPYVTSARPGFAMEGSAWAPMPAPALFLTQTASSVTAAFGNTVKSKRSRLLRHKQLPPVASNTSDVIRLLFSSN